MSRIDKILSATGLMRKTEHIAFVERYKAFTRLLGQAAKDAGVPVLLEDQLLDGVLIDSDLFMLGSWNYIRNCHIRARVHVAPNCEHIIFSGNIHGYPQEQTK